MTPDVDAIPVDDDTPYADDLHIVDEDTTDATDSEPTDEWECPE